ncbi:ATP-binding cassette domain-containing protein [Methyloversatilis sp.]|uniref:ATP-binding cassette domain-containing protein n=1 Tax=Methyloversatilis sp. TaxID=2569862 RepID=UPI0035AE717F
MAPGRSRLRVPGLSRASLAQRARQRRVAPASVRRAGGGGAPPPPPPPPNGRVGGRAERALARLEAVGLAGRADDSPGLLSGGELQRVAIARALVHRPRLLLADEPTGNLDAGNARRIAALLRDAVRSAGACGLLVTHSATLAATADRVLRLGADGRLHHG